MKPRAIMALVVLFAALLTTTYIHLLQKRLVAAQAALQDVELEAAGLRAAQVERVVAPTVVPSLAPIVKAAHKANVKTDIAAHVVYKQVETPIPCDSPSEVGDITNDSGDITLGLTAEADNYLALDKAGKPWFTSKLFVTATIGTEAHRVAMDEDTSKSTIVISDDIKRAIAAWNERPPRVTLLPRPIKSWRAGWVAGVGLTTNATGSPSVGAFAGWGVSF